MPPRLARSVVAVVTLVPLIRCSRIEGICVPRWKLTQRHVAASVGLLRNSDVRMRGQPAPLTERCDHILLGDRLEVLVDQSVCGRQPLTDPHDRLREGVHHPGVMPVQVGYVELLTGNFHEMVEELFELLHGAVHVLDVVGLAVIRGCGHRGIPSVSWSATRSSVATTSACVELSLQKPMEPPTSQRSVSIAA